MRRPSIFITFILSLFLLAWWVGYSGIIGSTDNKVSPKPPEQISQTQNAETSSPVILRAAEIQTGDAFSYEGWKLDTTGDHPKICIQFSHNLKVDSGLTATDYIRTEPSAQMTVEVFEKSMCLLGLQYAQDYELTLLKGYQSADGQALADDKTIAVSFGNQPPFVSFAGNGVILPRIGAQGLAIETVNINELVVEIFRVGDRILARRSPEAGETTAEGEYSYEYTNVASQVRERIWNGIIEIESSPNTLKTTVLPIGELIGTLKPGAYVVSAVRKHEQDDYTPARSWRWIISTDLALSTYQSGSGLDVSVRSIDSAKPVRGVKIDLVADNNEILGTRTTDADGRANFSKTLIAGPGALRPRMMMAYGEAGDYAVLDLNRAVLDLSAFDVGGRHAGNAIDAYVFADRGVYRPGETVRLSAMLRDKFGKSVGERDGQIRFIKPNGIAFSKTRFLETKSGTLLHDFAVPTSAPRGVWRALIEVDGIGLVGQASFSVEDFAPQQLRVDLRSDDEPIRGEEVRAFEVFAEFLYGADGVGLDAQAEARVRVDPKPFPKLTGFKFGLADETFRELYMDLGGGRTDGAGILELGLSFRGENIDTSHPLRVEITAGVSEPGGRYVQTSKRIPVRTNDIYIGIKPDFEDRAKRNTPAGFTIKAVDWQGESIALDQAQWILVEEDWHYNWYRQNDRWRYKREIRDLDLARGRFDITAEQGAVLSQTLNWGDYRLIIQDAEGKHQASTRFSVGWSGSTTSDAPDQIKLGGPDGPVKGGETITLNVNAPYGGIGELVIANDSIKLMRSVEIPAGSSEISVKLDEDLGAGVYALLTLYTPRNIDTRPIPRRAVGITYIPVDVSGQKLAVTINAPDVVKPRREQMITLDIDNAPVGEEIWLTLAAVDEGILQITKYTSPDPEAFYFGKKAFALDVRDDYARLLNPNLGAPIIAKSGGDGLGGEGLTASPIKVVSLYSGPVDVKNGQADISVTLPDFNGELRLMAVAWSDSALGSASRPMKVRDAVPSILALPRFMAPGDRALATMTLDNIDGADGEYAANLTSIGVLTIDDSPQKFSLKQGERKSLTHEILTNQTGVSTVDFNVSGPDGFSISSRYDLQTRSAFLPITRMTTNRLAAGESFTIDPTILQGLDPRSVDINVSFARTPGLDPTAYAASVNSYPYGCTEQTVSAALPLLYANDFGGVAGITPVLARQSLQKAVDRLLNRHGNDGAFGLWREGDGYANPWIGVYATDFLARAKEKDYVITEASLNRAYKALKSMTKMERYPRLSYRWRAYSEPEQRRKSRHAEAAAYAHYVLAREGLGDLSAMRYFYTTHASDMRTPLAWGHLAAALAMMDDRYRATEAFGEAANKLGYQNADDYYQSSLRDSAGLLALAKEVDETKTLEDIQAAFDKALKPPDQLHTQEKAQTILAIRAFLEGSEPLNITADHATLRQAGGISKAHIYGTDLANGSRFTNDSQTDIWRSVMISGTPVQAPLARQNGFALTKRITTFSGEAVDLGRVKQGDKFIVHVTFNSTQLRTRQVVLADLLPAGMEIEAILSAADGQGGNGAFAWLGELSNFQTAEARDDRLVAALETDRRDKYAIAYTVRAVAQGDFIWPGAVLEDMYRPADQALTPAQRVVISAGGKG